MDQEKIGRFLKELRREKDLTQEQLAELLNTSVRTVSRWETGSNMPDLSLLVALSELYGVDIREIINGERKSTEQTPTPDDTLRQVARYGETEKRKLKRKLLIAASAVSVLVCAVSILAICLSSRGRGNEETPHEPVVFAAALSGEGKRFPGGKLDPALAEETGTDPVIFDFTFGETAEKDQYRFSFRFADHGFSSVGYLIPARFNNYGRDHFLLSPVSVESDTGEYTVSKILLAFHANLHDLRSENTQMTGHTVATVWITEAATGDVYEFQLLLPDADETTRIQKQLSVVWEATDELREAADEYFFAKEKSSDASEVETE